MTTDDKRPVFAEGDWVTVDWQALKKEIDPGVRGIIRGLVSSDSVEDLWVVDFGQILNKVYPYACYAVPHSYLTLYTDSDRKKELEQSKRPNPRCPACRSRDLVLHEISTQKMEFHVCGDGVIRRVWGSDESEIVSVDACCQRCRHRWRLRRTVQVGEFCGWTETDELCNDETF